MDTLELSPLPQARGALRGFPEATTPLCDDVANALLAPAAPAMHDPASPSPGRINAATSIAEETGGRLWFEPPRVGEEIAARATPGASAPAHPEVAQEEGQAVVLTPGSDEGILDAGLTLVCRRCFSANLLALDHRGQPLDHRGQQRLLSHEPQVQMTGGLSYRCLQCGEVWQPERSGGGEICQPHATVNRCPSLSLLSIHFLDYLDRHHLEGYLERGYLVATHSHQLPPPPPPHLPPPDAPCTPRTPPHLSRYLFTRAPNRHPLR